MKEIRPIFSLDNIESDEVSVVRRGANKIVGFEIIKADEETEDMEAMPMYPSIQDVNSYYDEEISEGMWSAFKYAFSDSLEMILESDLPKESKITETIILFDKFINQAITNPYLKSLNEEADKLIKAMKTEAGKQYPASSYLYVPDAEKVSTWKLRIYDENGNLDKDLLSAAIASFSTGGFRGNQVQLPQADKTRIRNKLREIWMQTYPDKNESEMPEGIKKEEISHPEISLKQENEMQNEEKVSELKKLFDKISSLFKSEKSEDELLEKEEVIEEKSEEISKQEEKSEEIEKEVSEELSLEEVKKEEIEKQVEENVELRKAQDELIELKKQLESIEIEKAEKQIQLEKQELLNKAEKELSFICGTPQENVEKLYELKKSISEESFDWILSNLKKQSEEIEKEFEEIGKEVSGIEDMTALEKLAKIAKSIEIDEKVSKEVADRLASERNPDLFSIALNGN